MPKRERILRFHMKPTFFSLVLFSLLVLALDPGPASSGWLVGKISGRTRLSAAGSSKPLPDVTITLTNLDWGRERVLSSNRRGRFQFLNLTSGNYRVRVEKKGYRLKQIRRESVIRLHVNEPVRVLPAYDMIPTTTQSIRGN